MGWRDTLRRVRLPDGREVVGASFRGVPFFVDASERTGGRRAVVHEFPMRDQPFVDDLGRQARKFPIEGYVVGEDYMVDRDRLLAALEDRAGAGELVHPFYGARRAICTALSVRETPREGGMAVFQIELTEAAEAPAPSEAVDRTAEVASTAAAALVAARAEFEETFDITSAASYALTSLSAEVTALSAKLDEQLGPLATTQQ